MFSMAATLDSKYLYILRKHVVPQGDGSVTHNNIIMYLDIKNEDERNERNEKRK